MARRRRPWQHRARRLTGMLVVGLCITVLAEFGSRFVRREPLQAGGTYAIRKVVDGDTLVLENGDTIRLIGVDTPEVHDSPKLERDAAKSNLPEKTIRYMGRQAAHFVERACRGRLARIAFDPSNADRRHRDAYGRSLAHVYLVSPDRPDGDAIFLNREIVRQGYGRCMRYRHAYRREFQHLERYARRVKAGLWAHAPIP